ncbi:MAG: hypothetical protein IMZ55_18840 [Acidobacteria bacterium]|nr:hypothetical protein [Acidobacteriota bacterium]
MGKWVNPTVANDGNGTIKAVGLTGMAQAVYYVRIYDMLLGNWEMRFYTAGEDLSLVATSNTFTVADEGAAIGMASGTLGGTVTVQNLDTIVEDTDGSITFTWQNTDKGPGSIGGGMVSPASQDEM